MVADSDGMHRVAATFADFTQLLKDRHASIMGARPERQPGIFKSQPNQAGETVFVQPDLVAGTLEQGFDVVRGTVEPFHRAVQVMFLVTEVHPFTDGNGRLARVMMNAELVAQGLRRIVIPTVLRNNYVSALRALSQNGLAEPLFRTLNFAQRFTAAIDFADYDTAVQELERCNAFLDPGVADEQGIRLRLP